MSFTFNPVQRLFNGNFWQIFQSRFQNFGKVSVVDLACGTGELRKYINPQKYLGVDINKNHISYAKGRFQNYRNTQFLNEDITRLSIPTQYKAAFFISAVHHLSDQQLNDVFEVVKNSHLQHLIIIDGVPQGIFSGLLKWLDKILAGGEYFRDENQLVKILNKYVTIEEYGTFSAKFSLYAYPYAIVKP
ncbi:MAG: hypothetical protein UU73_C0001G0129 [Candidatus Daviesbacteria bacterium GW2011_GWA1_41_61]|uniref:Methyltransferase domain-containing protein n=1 Tax=Candidatus Daviesbacteria bacterium GW2011_GWA2_40_9 TaxID=1618424 RepID=A0A0G0U1N4_9BACT|nr:MAG: hypothetical protein UU26_C0001G0036 [Candidatus Daviesbacteria bacterium GW2011_GWC1_40_9]KKR83023.1 MAG: hypothetical protein UU29_C0008G0132 [Candidatus Daviesbacteria bacterium GW2011_GWA2_40_9]KKR92948.1 MAG: hypothetical protein UU44_C0004G0130 [Candidatus Daviesbacteria bacterium GW2011_GWB1_41_15]KKS15492.1 MAG: hypothetical protein UU73_C0001G0129 [Candidatus Daviesbacteria bacterium GW2011_GWA1_41_61]